MTVTLQTNLLKRKASRWQMRPTQDRADPDTEQDENKFSLLLFLRDLNTDEERHAAFVNSITNAAGAEDKDSIMHAMATAVQELRHIGHDYADAGNGKRRRLNVYGEEQAGFELGEHDQLMDLARTVWTDPDVLTDLIAEAYEKSIRTHPDDEDPSLDDLFSWARSWAEVRYRFLNHALRDDPVLYRDFRDGRARQKGDKANAIIHDSDVLQDSQLVEFKPVGNMGYTDEDRELFRQLYVLTPEEGRQLIRFTAPLTGLRAGLPAVFRFCVTFIDAYINWRIKMLTMARVRMLGSQALHSKKSYVERQREIAKQNAITADQLRSVENIYRARFVPRLKDLLSEAARQNAFYRESFNGLESAIKQIRVALSNSPFHSEFPELKNDISYRKNLHIFPGINLVPPTGTSMINCRPKRAR